MAEKPVMAIVSQSIRRDNHEPLKYFSLFEVVHFYHEAPYGDMTESDFARGVHAEQFRSPADLKNKLISLRPDVIQGSEPYASRKSLRFAFASQAAAKKVGAKFFFPMLENRPASARFGVKAPLIRSLLKKYARHSDLIFTLNIGAMHNLAEVGIDNSKIVPFLWGVWGVDTKLFTPHKNGQEPKWQLPTMLYVGRLVEEKGITDILQALKMVTSIKATQAVFVGQGPMEYEIKKYLGSSDDRSGVLYLGQRPQKDLPPLFRAAAMSVYPSRTLPKWEEQVGTVNLQAMSCGAPVVSTQSGAIPEYVPDGKVGFLVPESSPQELAKAMLAILNDQKLAAKFGKAGREYALKNFDVRSNVKKGEQWISKLLKN